MHWDMLVSTLLAVPSQRRSLGHDVVTAFGGKVAGWRSMVDLRVLWALWTVVCLESNGVGRENAVRAFHRWLVKYYFGELPYYGDETMGSTGRP